MPYIGQFTHAVDAQRRFAVPSHWRGSEDKPASFYLIPGFNARIHVIPADQFDAFYVKPTEGVSIGNEELNDTLANMGSQVHQSTCDKQGRINLSPELAAYAMITNEITLVGSFKDFQLYNPAHWAAIRKPVGQVLKHFEKIQEGAKKAP